MERIDSMACQTDHYPVGGLFLSSYNSFFCLFIITKFHCFYNFDQHNLVTLERYLLN